MAEIIHTPPAASSKKEKYRLLIPQLEALVSGENDRIANIANTMAALKDVMQFFWAGIYFVKDDELVLGPFQGPVACTRIGFGKGVCGTAWKEKKTIIVPDVNLFPGHIACSTSSLSEIVIPVMVNNEVLMVLDVDSDQLNSFDDVDAYYLSQVTQIIGKL